MKAQKYKILKWLESGKSITPIQALVKFGCLRLGARIHELRTEGVPVFADIIKAGNKRVAKYSLYTA